VYQGRQFASPLIRRLAPSTPIWARSDAAAITSKVIKVWETEVGAQSAIVCTVDGPIRRNALVTV
jgi:hypothetical protein